MQDDHPFPVTRIGLVGGGQLGRMLVKAAKQLGCTCVVLDPTPNSPAGQLATRQIVGSLHDADCLRALAADTDVITYEIEDIDTETLAELAAAGHRIHPAPALVAVVQDKLEQKRLLAKAGIATAEFREVATPDPRQFQDFGYPLVQKARRGGYDGRGVAILRSATDFEEHLPVPSLIERFVPAQKEIAVLVARGTNGETRCYPPVEMTFRTGENVLDLLLAPAEVAPDTASQAHDLAVRTVEALHGVGVFGVEMFLTEDGDLLVNEVAPRTHNSGHHTIEACVTDQFEQHLRAVIGLPLGSTGQLSPAAMLNLLGEPDYAGRPVIRGLSEALAIPGVCVHIYGKAQTRPFRKMGHVTVLDPDLNKARDKANRVRQCLHIIGEDTL